MKRTWSAENRRHVALTPLRKRMGIAAVVLFALAASSLFVAGAGSGGQAAKLPRNSVATEQVRDFSLLARDFRAGQLPRGPRGARGLPGATGAQGVAGAAGSV